MHRARHYKKAHVATHDKKPAFTHKKAGVLLLCFVLFATFTVGSSWAWLNAYNTTPDNVFVGSNLTIDLAETTGTSYTMAPGDKIAKNPSVTVLQGSEPCYLFMRPAQSDNFGDYVEYDIADGWIPYSSFVVDGALDTAYVANTAWYFDSTDDKYNDDLRRYVSNGGTTEHTGGTSSDIKMWVAYDSDYVYVYFKMYTAHTGASVRLYYDPDPKASENIGLNLTCASAEHGDLALRVDRNLGVYAENSFSGTKSPYNDSNFLQNGQNLVPFTINEADKTGFGFEIRLPRADDGSNTFQLNFAAEINTGAETNYAWTFGPAWWLRHSSMHTFTYNDSANPFVDKSFDGYYYRVIGEKDGAPLAANQTFTLLQGLNQTDLRGYSMADGYVQIRTQKQDGTLLNNTNMKSLSATLTFKAAAVQQNGITLAQAFKIAKPQLDQ